MKNLSSFMNESLFEANHSEFINECVVAAKKVTIDEKGRMNPKEGQSYVLVKHRDRAYDVSSALVRTVVNGIEIVYLEDSDTLWSEGMSEKGICIINASLSLADENMGKSKGGGKKDDKGGDKSRKANVEQKYSADGAKIIKALSMSNLEDAVHMAKSWGDAGAPGIFGNTIVADDSTLYTISATSQHQAIVSKLDGQELFVATNHAVVGAHKAAGYQPGTPSYKSSTTRQEKAEKILTDANTPEEMLVNMRKQPFAKGSQLNPLRTTSTLKTTSQMMLDPKNLHVHFVVFKEYNEHFRGVIDRTPSGWEPKIKVTFEEI